MTGFPKGENENLQAERLHSDRVDVRRCDHRYSCRSSNPGVSQDYTVRARVSEGLWLAGSAKLSVAENAANGAADLGAGYSAPATTTDKVTGIANAVTTGQITIGYGTKIEDAKSIVLVPLSAGIALAAGTPPAGPITWSCNGTDTTLAAKYRPAECR